MPPAPLVAREVQPFHRVIKERRLTFPAVAYAIGLPDRSGAQALRNAAYGITYPSLHMARALPAYLGVPLEELFTERALRMIEQRQVSAAS